MNAVEYESESGEILSASTIHKMQIARAHGEPVIAGDYHSGHARINLDGTVTVSRKYGNGEYFTETFTECKEA